MSSNESEEIVLISSKTQNENTEKDDSDSSDVQIEIINKKKTQRQSARQTLPNKRKDRRKRPTQNVISPSSRSEVNNPAPISKNVGAEELLETPVTNCVVTEIPIETSITDNVVTEIPLETSVTDNVITEIPFEPVEEDPNYPHKLNSLDDVSIQKNNYLTTKIDPEETFDKIGEFFEPKRVKIEDPNINKIICRDGERDTIYYLRKDDTLETLYNDFSPEAKLKYRGMFVSKYLTLEDLNFTVENNVFEVIGNNKRTIKLHINLDFIRGIDVTVEPSLRIGEIFKLFRVQPDKENLLVINGYILDVNKTVEEMLEDDDVIDYV